MSKWQCVEVGDPEPLLGDGLSYADDRGDTCYESRYALDPNGSRMDLPGPRQLPSRPGPHLTILLRFVAHQ
jgi:hypothetical protein